MEQAIKILVSGHVQGVGFRYGTYLQASKLELSGYVVNLADGRVEVVATGKQELVQQLIAWLRKGPTTAIVDNLEFIEDKQINLQSGFFIR